MSGALDVVSRATRRLRMIYLGGRLGSVGPRTWIGWPIDVLTNPRNIAIGSGVRIRAHARLEAVAAQAGATPGSLVIGDGTTMEGYCSISAAASVRVGRDVLIGANVTIRDHDHGFIDVHSHRGFQPLHAAPVEIGDYSWLGQNVVVTKGVRIGAGAVVGANAVVTRDVEAGAVVVGIPARQIGWADGRQFTGAREFDR